MNEDVEDYSDRSKTNKMKKNDTVGNSDMKNLEEQLMKSLYQHLNNCNERNDASHSGETNVINNLNRNSDITNGKPRNGDYNKYKNYPYRNICGSSSSEDDDEHCVYTYKGELANLSESNFNVGVDVTNRNGSRSSPDMDYLEMDFDPGPYNGQDSDSDNASHDVIGNENLVNEHSEPTTKEPDCDYNAEPPQLRDDLVSKPQTNELSSNDNEQPCCSKSLDAERLINEKPELNQSHSGNVSNNKTSPNRAHFSHNIPFESNNLMQFKICKYSVPTQFMFDFGDYDEITFIADDYREELTSEDSLNEETFVRISNDDDIIHRFNCFDDLLPIDPTYCISAIVNLLTASHFSHDSYIVRNKLAAILQNRKIPENTPLVDYLFSRTLQNANITDFMHLLSVFPECQLHSRFFSTYPQRNVDYLKWMSHWMKKGALLIVTRNVLERGTLPVSNIIYNQWRYNLVYKIEYDTVSLTNPTEHIKKSDFSRQLCQPPLIHIKRSSVMKRWHSKADLTPLLKPNDQRWYSENVLGQLATVIREHSINIKTKHYIRIPSNCHCGITLLAPSENTNLCKEIDDASELPLILKSVVCD